MSIADTFRNGVVFITGSTGFLGKILTEKLLRSCDVKSIVVLVRGKNGLSASQRAADTFKQTMFDRLRIEKPDFVTKIKIIDGYLDESSFGISADDYDWLIKNVNFVFHCAATVKFNETLEVATRINIQGTENVLALATKMNNLKGFVYVSTAYSHCPRSEIKEEFYHVSTSAKELKKIIKLDGKTCDVSVDWPNTYSFTKALTENMILTNENRLPISVFRPSINIINNRDIVVGCTRSEPEPGWSDNFQGVNGVVTPLMVGMLRAMPMSMDKKTDIVPVDYTANALIGVMWDTVNRYRDGNENNEEPKIYNFVSSFDTTLRWRTFFHYIYESYYQVPPLQSMWYICCIFSDNSWVIGIMRFLLHWIPAAVVDLSLFIRGKKPILLKMYKKKENMTDMLKVFTTSEWKFDNSNTRKLWALLSEEDRKKFWFSFEGFDWKSYIRIIVYGIRKNILHEDLNNMTKALAKHRKLFWLHKSCIFLVVFIVFTVFCMFVPL